MTLTENKMEGYLPGKAGLLANGLHYLAWLGIGDVLMVAILVRSYW